MMSALRQVTNKHLGGMECEGGLEGCLGEEGWHSSLGRGWKMRKHRLGELSIWPWLELRVSYGNTGHEAG